MKSRLFDTISPKIAWFPIGLILTYFLAVLIFCIITNPFDAYLTPFYCSVIILSLLIFAAIRKLRKIDFNGKEFLLKNTRNQITTIDVLLFKEVTSFFWFTYSIRFTDGRYFIFLINPVTELFESISLNKFRVYYDVEITKEIYGIIEKDYPLKSIDAPNYTESKGKFFFWSLAIMTLIYYSTFHPLIYIFENNHSTTPKETNYYAEFKGEVIEKHRIENGNTTPFIEIKAIRDWDSKLYLSNYYSAEFDSIKIGDTLSTMKGDSNLYITRIDTSFIVRKIR